MKHKTPHRIDSQRIKNENVDNEESKRKLPESCKNHSKRQSAIIRERKADKSSCQQHAVSCNSNCYQDCNGHKDNNCNHRKDVSCRNGNEKNAVDRQPDMENDNTNVYSDKSNVGSHRMKDPVKNFYKECHQKTYLSYF